MYLKRTGEEDERWFNGWNDMNSYMDCYWEMMTMMIMMIMCVMVVMTVRVMMTVI
jgi:hypothetical protein